MDAISGHSTYSRYYGPSYTPYAYGTGYQTAPEKSTLEKIAPWALVAAAMVLVDFNKLFQSIGNLFKLNPANNSPKLSTVKDVWNWMTQHGIDHDHGHIRYSHHALKTADAVNVTMERRGATVSEPLHKDAAAAWKKMQAAALDDGVLLGLTYGYRSDAEQDKLYKADLAKNGGDATKTAQKTAKAGFSEHETGYAIDVYDKATNGKVKFGTTAAYRWMVQHAEKFGFKQSFKPQPGKAFTKQGTAKEEWHWRFEGTPEAKAIFADARKIDQLSD